jgi:hypothetical protein
MAKVIVSIGETLGNMTLPELKKYESLRLDASIEMDSDEEKEPDMDKLAGKARAKCIETLKKLTDEYRQHSKERDIKKG